MMGISRKTDLRQVYGPFCRGIVATIKETNLTTFVEGEPFVQKEASQSCQIFRPCWIPQWNCCDQQVLRKL